MSRKILIFGLLAIGILCLVLLESSYRTASVLQGYVEGELTYLSSNVTGKLTKLNVLRGQSIQQGQQIFTLEAQPEIDALQSAEANLSGAKAQLSDLEKGQRATVIAGLEEQKTQAQAAVDLAQIQLKRFQSLLSKNNIDKSTVDQAQADYISKAHKLKEINANIAEASLGGRADVVRAKQFDVNAATASFAQAQWTVQQKTVTAPRDGVVFDIFYRFGEIVPATHPVVSILSPEYIQVIFFVPEAVLGKVHMGDEVTFNCDSCKQKTAAKICFISPQAEFTPPVIYSESSRDKLVYKIRACMPAEIAKQFHPGQPVSIFLKT